MNLDRQYDAILVRYDTMRCDAMRYESGAQHHFSCQRYIHTYGYSHTAIWVQPYIFSAKLCGIMGAKQIAFGQKRIYCAELSQWWYQGLLQSCVSPTPTCLAYRATFKVLHLPLPPVQPVKNQHRWHVLCWTHMCQTCHVSQTLSVQQSRPYRNLAQSVTIVKGNTYLYNCC